MRGFLPAIGLSILVLGQGCAAGGQEVEWLRWLEDADAEQVFRSDQGAQRVRFFVVYGYAREMPGVGETEFARCYSGVEVTVIEGTSDALVNEEHRRLNQKARDFAEAYNTIMREELVRTGRTSCRQN